MAYTSARIEKMTDNIHIKKGSQMIKKRVLSIITMFVITTTCFNSHFILAKKQQAVILMQSGQNKILVNGLPAPIDMAPEIKFGKMFISIRTLTNEVWMVSVQWYPAEKKVTVTSRCKNIIFWIGNNMANVDGQSIQIDKNPKIVPYIKNGRSMLPVKFITDNLNAKSLEYDAKAKTAKVVLEWFPNDLKCDWPTRGGNTQKQYWIPSSFELKSINLTLKSKALNNFKVDVGLRQPMLLASDGKAYFCVLNAIYVYTPETNTISILKKLDMEFSLYDITISDDKMICSSGKGLICIDRLTGNEVWRKFDMYSQVFGSYFGVEISQNKIIRISSYEIHCYNVNDGMELWKINQKKDDKGKQIEIFGFEYVIDEKLLWLPTVYGNNTFSVSCINLNDGKHVWTRNFRNPVKTKLFIDSKIVVVEQNNGIHALDAWTGNEVWHNKQVSPCIFTTFEDPTLLSYNLYSYMAVHDQNLICQDKVKMYCLDSMTGKMIWDSVKNHVCSHDRINTFSFLVDSKRIFAYEKNYSAEFGGICYQDDITDKIRIYDLVSGKLITETVINSNARTSYINAVIFKGNLYILYSTTDSEYPSIAIFKTN